MKKKLLLLFVLSLGFSFAQVPTAKPQPATPTYALDQLILLPEYTRASYESTFGVQAGAYDVTRAPKTWFDSTKKCDNAVSTYQRLDPGVTLDLSSVKFVSFTVSNCDASRVNLKGLPHFDKYVLPFSRSNITIKCTLSGCVPQEFSGGLQSTREMAEAMLAEIGDPSLTITDRVPGPVGSLFVMSKVDPTSSVSLYYIGTDNVNVKWVARNVNGVGYPGKWVKTSNEYNFVPALLDVGATDTRPNVPVPNRLLFQNEKFAFGALGLLGAPLFIARTDVASPVIDTGVSVGGGFTQTDRVMLQQIFQMLTGIK